MFCVCTALCDCPISIVGIYTGIIDEKLHVGLSGTSDVMSIADVPYLTWTHVAMQYDRQAGTQSLYINGQLNETSSTLFADVSLDKESSLLIGQNGSTVLDGAWIDEVVHDCSDTCVSIFQLVVCRYGCGTQSLMYLRLTIVI